jgi:hypothetical protein
MRYNPPPNWPKPPEGWEPYPDWQPDPAWPPPPEGWQLWVEHEEGPDSPAALGRLKHAGDDGEYFGDENAWADDSGPARSADDDQLDAVVSALPPHPTEVPPEELAVQHLGQYATVKWADERQYAIGTIVAIAADVAEIRLTLDGIADAILFPRDTPGSPRLLVWI